ncbi:hypothetical protein GCK72_003140 [Caenorhabditis remanei]|uniref:F-box domain-containing protein n=1 Tax=Caenorhabditis remanei TaxID=31234 RepID=A0A6A5HWT4_CAERE|nr:hypothetical protein GCK72_003140 [Caenorhabditis remanei]KAF1771314.1 hypothetical protein GCK72_003140 [Caenorhabditis remanei]
MSSPFPLLRLPGVILCEVFKSLNIGEKIKLSLCSKKTSAQINSARLYSQKVIVDLSRLYQKLEVSSENDKDAFEVINCSYSGAISDPKMQQCPIAGLTVPVIFFDEGITTFWKNHQEGFLSVIEHLLKMFQCKFSIYNAYNSDSLQPIISELFNLQVEFQKLTIYLKGSKDEIIFWNQISNKLELVEDLELSSILKPNSIPVFNSWPQKIGIIRSDWFTLEHLLTCTCTTIELGWSHLGMKDLNTVLKNWKAGGFPNLEYLYVEGQNIQNNGTMNWSQMVIQTDDGSKKATINTRYNRLEMYVTPFD